MIVRAVLDKVKESIGKVNWELPFYKSWGVRKLKKDTNLKETVKRFSEEHLIGLQRLVKSLLREIEHWQMVRNKMCYAMLYVINVSRVKLGELIQSPKPCTDCEGF